MGVIFTQTTTGGTGLAAECRWKMWDLVRGGKGILDTVKARLQCLESHVSRRLELSLRTLSRFVYS